MTYFIPLSLSFWGQFNKWSKWHAYITHTVKLLGIDGFWHNFIIPITILTFFHQVKDLSRIILKEMTSYSMVNIEQICAVTVIILYYIIINNK